MLFNSFGYIFLFLPLTVCGYFVLNRYRMLAAAKVWLAAASLFFYGMWNINFLAVMLGSIFFNFAVGTMLQKTKKAKNAGVRRSLFVMSLFLNVALLGYYKYADFFLQTLNALLQGDWPLLQVVLPLGISFFTITQVAYLVDVYEGLVEETDFLNYLLFVTFFPHLLMGPILHHKQMMPQFSSLRNQVLVPLHIYEGIVLFTIGLSKKVLLADLFAGWVRQGFDLMPVLTFTDACLAVLFYALQLYFDFSGYTDMALGAALLFNLRLPVNFNSPFKARNVIEFWQRWHISLTRFITTYIYTPLVLRAPNFSFYYMARAILISMLIAGLWHEASWGFLTFYFFHAGALILNHWWKKKKYGYPRRLAWGTTFVFVVLTLAVTRIKSFAVLQKFMGAFMMSSGFGLAGGSSFGQGECWLAAASGLFFALYGKNSQELAGSWPLSRWGALVLGLLFAVSVLQLNKISEFLYFNF